MHEAWGRGQDNYAAVKDAPIKLRLEECALGMRRRSSDAAVRWMHKPHC